MAGYQGRGWWRKSQSAKRSAHKAHRKSKSKRHRSTTSETWRVTNKAKGPI